MNQGEIFTRFTMWLTLAGYTGGALLYWTARRHWRGQAWARYAWTFGAGALLAHTLCALHFYHHWQSAAVWRETARQTAAVTGWNWGGGVYFNYALLLAWLADAAWWWRAGLSAYLRRATWLTASWHGFLLFMFFNATVVFKTNWLRWLGLGICLSIALSWWRAVQTKPAEFLTD